MDVFLTKYGHESSVIFRERTFFYRIWARDHQSIDFYRKIIKKGILLSISACKIIVLTELTFFGPNMGMTEGVFSWTIWSRWHESTVFERNGFFVKIRKKWHLIDFFGPLYSLVMTEMTFFVQIWVWQQGVSHKNLK